jgi:hypothetical protein
MAFFRNLFQRFGGWTTVKQWNEPTWFRIQLKGDWLARLAVAAAVGWVGTAVLLVLFAMNRNPPAPWYALFGMLVLGGFVLLLLVHGRGTASGRVRLCEEGICRKRNYAGLSAQWAEEVSWPYEQIHRCEVLPGERIGRSYSLLVLYDSSSADVIAVRGNVDLKEVVHLMMSRGVAVQVGSTVPAAFTRSMALPYSLAASALGTILGMGAAGFYAVKTAGRPEKPLAGAGRVQQELPNEAGQLEAAPVIGQLLEAALDQAKTTDAPVPVGPRHGENPLATNTSSAPAAAPPRPDNPFAQFAIEPVVPAPAAVAPAAAASSPAALPPGEPHKSETVGGPGGFPFETVHPEQRPVVGFRFAVGSWAGSQALSQLEPIFGRENARSAAGVNLAREGYVVGGLEVDAQSLVHAVRIIYVRQREGGAIATSDSYMSDWLGQRTSQDAKKLGQQGSVVVGIHGRRGAVIDAIGLVTRAAR